MREASMSPQSITTYRKDMTRHAYIELRDPGPCRRR
jgi:hypothetical protein